MSVKYFLPVIFLRYSGKVVEKRKRIKAIMKCYAFQANAKKTSVNVHRKQPFLFSMKKKHAERFIKEASQKCLFYYSMCFAVEQ